MRLNEQTPNKRFWKYENCKIKYLKKWFQPYTQGDQNATQHTKNVQEQVIMKKA